MTGQGIPKLKLAYGIALSALTALVGGLFVLQVWAIFFSADRSPFTYAIIGEKFLQILAPVCLWVLGVIGGAVIPKLYPDEPQPLKGYVSPRTTLYRLKARLPLGSMSALKREKWLKAIVWSAAGIACVGALTAMFAILFDPAYEPLTSAEFMLSHDCIADRLVRICIFVAECVLTCLIAVFTDDYIVKYETKWVKEQLAENAKKGIKPQKAEKRKTLWERLLDAYPVLKSKWWKQGLQIGLCGVGVALVIVGIFNGGMGDVFEKARNICTQCIGLG